MSFSWKETGRLDAEIAHHYESNGGDFITSTANRFKVRRRGQLFSFSVPLHPVKGALAILRLARRALRIDKSNAVFNWQRDGVVVLYGGSIYFYDLEKEALSLTGRLSQCRNVLHCGIAVTEQGLFFGEYGRNSERRPVPVWRSSDDGRSWQIVYEFPEKSIRHIHGLYRDPFTGRLWIPTGDFAGECFVVSADPDFREVTIHGDGSQVWRPVSLLFEKDRILWPMDSQLESSHLQEFDRATGKLTQHRAFPGPVWYSKRLADGVAVLQTTVERGAGVLSDHCHVFASKNLTDWVEVAKYKKDPWPMPYFKSGVAAFADGEQSSDDFVIFGEALEDIDGKVLRIKLSASEGL